MAISSISSASPQYPQFLQVLNGLKQDGSTGVPPIHPKFVQIVRREFVAQPLQPLFRSKAANQQSEIPLEERQRLFVFEEKSEFPPVRREEIKGIDNILEILSDPIELLRNYQKLKPPARLPPGLLFVGPPGTGKSFVERYIATETGVRSVNVRDFPRKGGPWTAADIRELCRLLRAYVQQTGQSILAFWDEFDSVALYRGSMMPDQKEALLELLHQLDGNMGRMEGVFLIGSTNKSVSDLDPALIRPGRLGKPILFSRPDLAGKMELLKSSVAGYPHEKGVDYEGLANLLSPETVAADIPSLVQIAYNSEEIRSRREGTNPQLTYEGLKATLVSRLIGQKADVVLTEDEAFEIAVHELGHAIVGRKLGIPVQLVTVVPTNEKELVPGKTIKSAGKNGNKPSFLLNHLSTQFGGEIAMEIVGLEPDGMAADRPTASEIAGSFVEEIGWGKDMKGFSLKGVVAHRKEMARAIDAGLLSEKMKWKAEKEIVKLYQERRRIAEKILKKFGKERIEWLARLLVERKYILQKELDELIAEAERRFEDPAPSIVNLSPSAVSASLPSLLEDLLSLPAEIASQEDEERVLRSLTILKSTDIDPGIGDLGYELGGIDLVQKVVRVLTTIVIKASFPVSQKASFILFSALSAEQNRENPEEYFLALIEGYRRIACLAPRKGLPFEELGKYLLNPEYPKAASAALEVFGEFLKRADPGQTEMLREASRAVEVLSNNGFVGRVPSASPALALLPPKTGSDDPEGK
jgi:ATP-dependent Zn protease